MVEPLTGRELEVLRHVSGVLRNPEIASEMHISLHTVKAHLKHIYRKLAATHRGEAVRRARQLGLIRIIPHFYRGVPCELAQLHLVDLGHVVLNGFSDRSHGC